MRYRQAFVSILLASLGVIGAVAGVVVASEHESRGGRLAVLERAATDADRLPDSVLAGTAGEVVADPSAARFLGEYQGHGYYVAPATEDRLCIISHYLSNDENGVVCNGRQQLFVGMWLGEQTDAGDQVVVVLVPDGYDNVSSNRPEEVVDRTEVQDNRAFFVLKGDTSLVLSGPDVPEARIEIPALPAAQ